MGLRVIYAAVALTKASANTGERPKFYTPGVKAFFNDVVSPVERSRELGNDDAAGTRATIDLSDYSFRYARCQTLSMWNDEAAAQGDDGNNYGVRQSVTTAEDFVVFRFCPTDSCVDGSGSGNPYGCTGGYGEYMLTLADYLDERFNYLENKRLQHCSSCVEAGCTDYSNGANYNYENVDDNVNYGGGQSNSYYYNNDDAGGQAYYYKYNNANANSYNGQYNNYYNHRGLAENYTDDAYDSCDATCPSYNQTCGSEFYYDQDFTPSDFFECSAIYGYDDDGQRKMLYVGAHCAARSGSYYSNGNDIAIGLFSDQYCTQFVGNTYDIATFTGLPFEDDMLKRYYSESCETCLAADLEYYDIDDDGNEDKISRNCAYLYGISAKCHKYMVGYNYTNTTISDYEKSVDEKNCAFIENVASGKYSETGEIIISNKKYNNQKRKHSEHQEESSAIAFDQALWLGGFAVINVALLIYSVIIIRSIRSRKPWRKTGGGTAALAGKISQAGMGGQRNFNYQGGSLGRA